MSEAVKVGIAGAGGIARRIHAPGWVAAGAEVVALYDPDRSAAEATQAAIKGMTGSEPVIYRTIADMLGHRGLNVVDVCSVNAAHAPLAIAAMRAGKHVVVEKPFADTLPAARDAYYVWRGTELFGLGVGNNLETHWFRTLRHVVQSGEIGIVYNIDAVWEREQGIPLRGSGFTRKEIAGGGAGIDLGAHLVGMVNAVLGEARLSEVMAYKLDHGQIAPSFPQDGVYGGGKPVGDGFCDVEVLLDGRLRFTEGALPVNVNLHASWVRPGALTERMYFRVEGTNGAITYERIWGKPDDDSTATWTLTQTVGRQDIPGVHSCANTVVWNRNKSPHLDDPIMGREVVMQVMSRLINGATIEGLRQEGYAAPTLEDHLRSMHVLDRMYESAKLGLAIEVSALQL